MTFPASLDKHSPQRHAFKLALRSGAALSVISAAVYVLIIVIDIVTKINMMKLYGSMQGVSSLDQLYVYSFLERGGTGSGIICLAFIFLFTILQALTIFGFLFSKKASTVYFGLGLTRKRLFDARFYAGVLEVLLPILLAMTVSLVFNLVTFSRTGLILLRFFQLTFGLGVSAMLFYTVTVLIATLVGTYVENGVYGLLALLTPSGLFLGFNLLCKRFLFGNGFGTQSYYQQVRQNFLLFSGNWNPILFFYRSMLSEHGSMQVETLNQAAAKPLSLGPTLAWLGVVLIMIWFSARCFAHRKVEITGFLGVNKHVGRVLLFPAALVAFGGVVLQMNKSSVGIGVPGTILVGSAVALLVLTLAGLPLHLLRAPFKHSAFSMGASLAAMLACVAILATGGLGYSSYVPDAGQVASTEISYHGYPSFVPLGSGGSDNFGWEYEMNLTLENPEDIRLVTDLHHGMVERGAVSARPEITDPDHAAIGTLIAITYTMKDGSVVTRDYPQSSMISLKALLALDNTEGLKQQVQQAILGTGGDKDDAFDRPPPFRWQETAIINPWTLESKDLSLDEAKGHALLEALAQDISAQSTAQRYFPEKPELAILRFYKREGDMGNMYMQGLDPYSSYFIFVTEDMIHTVSFLRDNGFLPDSLARPEVEWIGVQNQYRILHNIRINRNNPINPLFFTGEMGSLDNFRSLCEGYGVKQGLEVTDPDKISAIVSNTSGQYHMADGGYIVYIKYKGSDNLVSRFLPASKAPQAIIDYPW